MALATVPEVSIRAKVYLGSQFWRFQLKVNGTHCLGSLVGFPDGGTKEPVTGKTGVGLSAGDRSPGHIRSDRETSLRPIVCSESESGEGMAHLMEIPLRLFEGSKAGFPPNSPDTFTWTKSGKKRNVHSQGILHPLLF